MADGREYAVPRRDSISVAPTRPILIVHEDSGRFATLPLMTVTALVETGGGGLERV